MSQIITNTDDGSYRTLTHQEQETDEIIILEGLRDVQTVVGALYKYIECGVYVCVCVCQGEERVRECVCVCVSERERGGIITRRKKED